MQVKSPANTHAGVTESSLRDVRQQDVDKVLQLWRELMDMHAQLDPRLALADDADRKFLNYLETARSRNDYRVRIALDQSDVVGFAISCVLPNSPVYANQRVGYINDLCVTQAVRGRGYGRALVTDAVIWLQNKGAISVEAYVAHKNANALAFWHKVGGENFLDRLSLDLSKYRKV